MTLSPFDDLPIHQIAEPIRHVATSDRNFYDRFYFNCFAPEGGLMLIAGMGVYPNLGVADAFAVVNDGTVHRVVRASRELGADRADMSVGPFHIEVVEGLRRVRVLLRENEHGLDFDLTWDGFEPAHEEPRHFDRTPTGRVLIDSMRFAQTGRWTGKIRVGERAMEVTPDRWVGTRDRSWGVRPVGEPEPQGITGGRPLPGFFWLNALMQFPDRSLFFITQERPDGRRILEQSSAVRSFASGAAAGEEARHLGEARYELTFAEGSRDVVGAVLHLGDTRVRVTPLVRTYLIGLGYGFDQDWGHGRYQGPLKVEGREWDLTTEEGRQGMWGMVDAVARFELDDGTVGYGLFESIVLGPHEPSGFDTW